MDEPFVGQDPITMGLLIKSIDELNFALGITGVVLSHDVKEVLSISDYVYIISDQKIIAKGTAKELQPISDTRVRQLLYGTAAWY